MSCFQEPDFRIFETANLPIRVRQQGALEGYKLIITSIKQLNVLLEFNSDDPNINVDVDENLIYLHLSQEDTSKFKKGPAILQINVYYHDEEREASSTAEIYIGDNLHKEVMP